MSFDDKRQEFSRIPCTVVEIELPFCELTHSVSPCTATGTGDDRCFNTRATCQDLANFTPEPRVYRFVDTEGVPVGLDAVPCVQNVSLSPATIEISGGLGVRSKATVTMRDLPASDLDTDPYISGRTYIAMERGTYWTKFRARNPFYIGQPMRVLKGYLNEDGSFNESNFQALHYVLESITVSNGRATIIGKDPLKLADDKRAQAPRPSRGELVDPISAGAANFNVTDASEYSIGDFVRVRAEVMEITSITGSTLFVNRGQFNTAADEHGEGDTVQLCLRYDGERLDDILSDLLINYADVDPNFIPAARWQDEVNAWLPGLLSTLITEPTGVSKLLTELGEQAPHTLYWDERLQEIELRAVQPPPINAEPLNDDANFLEGSVSIQERPELRASTVLVYFGQFDPTRKLDETNNYQQVYARIDADSIGTYGSNVTKVIFSRWLTNLNKAGAVLLAQRQGRRFSDVPRQINFSLDAKDIHVWAGQTVSAKTRDLVDFTGAEIETPFQITSVQPSDSYAYTGIEYTYGPELPDDQEEGEAVIRIGADINNLNIRDAYDSLFPAPDSSTVVRLIVEPQVVIGSTSTAAALVTGSFPMGMPPIKLDIRGTVAGRGGAGADVNGSAGDGGLALELNFPAELLNTGIVGGGGGGGGWSSFSVGGATAQSAGGGGAGRLAGSAGTGSNIDFGTSGGSLLSSRPAGFGTVTAGGLGAQFVYDVSSEIYTTTGGAGGGLGQAGAAGDDSAGGSAGVAIQTNGNSLIQTQAGDIRGAIV